MKIVSPGRARRRAAASSVGPIVRLSDLPASLHRTRRSRPDRRTSLCENLLARGRCRSRPDLLEFQQFEAERLDVRKDAEQRGPILEQAGEHGLAAVALTHHRRKGRQGSSSEPAPYPDRIQARRCGHAIILPPDLVSRRRRNPVIVPGGRQTAESPGSGDDPSPRRWRGSGHESRARRTGWLTKPTPASMQTRCS